MFTMNSVPTTCTARLITGWSFPQFADINGIDSTNNFLSLVDELINQGFMTDFAIIHVFVTGQQLNNPRVGYFLEKVGFSLLMCSKKDNSDSRHKETGDLSLYGIRPADYKEGLLKFKKELLDLIKFLNRPKIPDPERLKFPELKLFNLRKEGLVQNNARVDNNIKSILLVPEETFYAHIRMKYGYDIKSILKTSLENISTRYLKEVHESWRNEKCIYA